MTDLRDYKNKNFSITVNSRMKGIELRFENTMTEEQIEQIKEAGFRWSKRQQMWYAYQNEKTIAYAKSLESQYEANLKNDENKQEKTENLQVEQTVLLKDLIAELREEIRKQNEKIKELEEIIVEKNNENEEILLEAENGEKMTIDELNQWNEEHALQEEIDDLEEGNKFIESNIEEETEIVITEEELEICKKIIPPNQYAYTLGLTQGEEGDFYKQKLKDIAKIAMQITTDDELINEDGSHNVGFHYFVGNSDFYISEIKSDGTAFGYTILNGDVEMAEWGYQDIDEIINASQWIEMDYHVPEGMTIERMLEEKYPEYYKQESVVEIEQQSDVIVPREKIFSIFNKYISNEEYATEKANKFIKGWENKDFNSLAEGLVFKKDTTAELRKLFNETEKVSLPEGNSNHLEVYTYLTKFADVETIPTEGKFNTWNDVIDYDIKVRTSLENKKNIFNFFQTHTSQTERTNYLKKEYSNGGGGVLPFNYVYTSDGIYLKALIDGKIKEKSYTWAEYTKFISDKISQGTYYTEPKIEKVTNKFIPSFNLLNEKYAIEFEPADEGKIDVNSEADKWIVKFYDISKVIPGEIDKGRFIQKYYASSLLQNQNSTVGLNLGYGWSLDAETFNRAKEIIKDFVSLDMSEIFSSKQNNTQQEKTKIENDKEYARELADWIIQHGLECSLSMENYHVSFSDILENTNTPKEWLDNQYNIDLVNEALAAHNDNELLDYNPEENEEKEFSLYFCTNARNENDLNTLFKKDDFGRWIRKSEEELNLERQEYEYQLVAQFGFTGNEGLFSDEFDYKGNTYIPFRAFREASPLEKYNNENEWITITHNLDWNNAVLKKENVKDYSVKSFYEAAGGKDKCKADIFYCINKSCFVLPTDAGIAKIDTEKVDIDSADFQYDAEVWYAEQFEKQQINSKKDIKAIREQCRQILGKPDSEITETDKAILAQYEGGGGINEENRTSAQVLNEFYTPNNLIEKVWNLVDAYNPNAVTVLEPTAGIGKFANNRPNNQFTMHELDETSARINKILHPEANVIQGAYQKQFLDEHERILNEDYVQSKYDIVIGNPPYGEYSGKYKNIEGKHHQRYEEYFIEKGLDALKDENSILAYVVPSGFLDSKNDKQKELIASKGQFVDAYRLPVGTFSTTDVGTDILIMRSWDKVRKEFDREFTNDGHFTTKEKAIKSFQRGNAELLSNGEYFKDHPEKILGEIKQRTNQFGKLVDTVVHHEGLSIQDELNKIDDFVADIKKGNTYEKQQESNIEIIEEEPEELEVIEEVKEETPQKNKITTKTKEENQEKKLAPVMTSEEFSKLYGRDFKAEELPIWKATDWEGNIDTSKLSFQEENLLHESSNYVEIEPGKFTHRVLFESGDIGSKIEDYKAKIKVIQFNNEDSAERKIALYEKNIAELEKITPTKIPMERLHFGLNSTLSEEFMVEHINAEGEIVKLNLQESFILWAKGQTYAEVTDKNTYYWRGGIDFATANISQEDFPQSVSWYDIVEYIDKKPVKAERVTGTWNKEEYEIKADKAQARREADEKRMARSETADKLFDKYLHEGLSEDLSKRVEAEYNRRFNSYVIPDYSKLPLFIDGMSRTKNGKKFKLYDQQIKGVSFLCNKGNGLLAYDVGVGKTAAGIVATVNQIQTGRSKRPVIVIPNAVYAKWYNDICELFPNIKVNDLYNLNKESTEKYRNKDNPHKLDIEENSISLITYEGLKNITFNDQSCENELFNDFSKLLSVDFDGSSRENAKNADNIKNVIGISSQVKNTNYVFFEDCGFDNITVDEAHNFKNLWTVPRPKNKGESNEFAGIPSGKPSARALKLFAMTQYTQRHNDDRNVFLLTATPFTNSPLEVYSMLSYVGRKRLIDSGLYSLRDFCNQFAHTKLELGVNSKGEIDQKQVMKDWKELPALQKILTEFIDKVDGEELKEIIRPKKFTHVQELEMSPLQKQMMEIDTQLMNEVKEGNSAAVIVSMNAMRVGLVAPALADPARYPDLELPSMEKLVETSPKLKFVCDSVIDMYKNHPEKGQFIFMPLGQTAHGIVKDYLIAHGIPKETVEIINGSINNTTEKKDKLTQKFNNPKEKCKILIGGKNTSEGIDLNGNSFAMYNCSLGWNPSETIQAEGRIWRQGNQQGHVHCVYPVMNDSIDSLLYQKHDEKRSRINELWTYKDSDTLNIEDINPEDLKFDLIKDPQKRAKLILENGIDTEDFKFVGTKSIKNELNKVNNRIKSFDEVYEKQINLKKNLEEAEFNIQRIEKNIEDYKNADLETPEWCKAELKDNRKYKTNYEHQLETISRKFASWGIKDEIELEEFIPNLNKQKRTLEAELQAKEKELPKILKMEMLKLNEKKVLLPSISEQRKILTEDIQKNLRPMTEVEPEIRTERFEQMLNLKWERGEISADEAELYSSVGYKNYYAWLDGEIESLGVENIIEKQTEIVQEKTVDISTDKKVEEKQNESNSFSGELFSESELEELATINEKLNPQLKKHQVIYYYEDSGIDEGLDFMTLSEAQKEGKTSLKEWNLDKSENGFAIFNRETKQIEAIHGYFPVEKVFRNEILAINGYKIDESKQEVSLSEIQKSTKEKLAEQGASKELFDSHVVFATPDKIKKEYADSYEW